MRFIEAFEEHSLVLNFKVLSFMLDLEKNHLNPAKFENKIREIFVMVRIMF